VNSAQQGVHAAVNVGDMTMFPALHVEGLMPCFLPHGGNVMHVRGLTEMLLPINHQLTHFLTYVMCVKSSF
jgi:hypothetical protein